LKELQYDKYCVTGAAGFIGSHIAEEIIRQGKEVVCVDNLVAGDPDNLESIESSKNARIINWDVIDSDFKFNLKDVDVIFHNAASKCTVCREDPKLDLMTNALGSYYVFEAARQTGVKKVIHASTGSVFNGKPKSFYGVSKLAGESYLRAFKEYYPDFNFTSIRYHHVYGPRQDSGPNGGVIPIFITKLLKGEPVPIFGDGFQQRHFTYVKDVVDYNFRAEARWDNQFIDLAEPDSMTLLELVKMLASIMNVSPVIEFHDAKPGDIRSFDVCDSVIKRRDFYWAQFRENLKETIEYYKT
jgi:nucleoside-diphosphate-sugar epimerase